MTFDSVGKPWMMRRPLQLFLPVLLVEQPDPAAIELVWDSFGMYASSHEVHELIVELREGFRLFLRGGAVKANADFFENGWVRCE